MGFLKTNITLLFLLLAFQLTAQQRNPMLEQEITFVSDSIKKSSLLDSIAKKYHLFFSYNPDLLQATTLVKPQFESIPLNLLLNQLLNGNQLAFKAIDNQIVIFPIHTSQKNDVTIRYKIIRGVVVTGKKEQVIPYCNIAVSGTAMGTMANNEGEFALKIPEEFWTDSLSFSCLGYETVTVSIETSNDEMLRINLTPKTFQLQSIDVFNYNTNRILDSVETNLIENYPKTQLLHTTFYRELIKENDEFTDISEAILEVLKSPYGQNNLTDQVKFIKGRKSAEKKQFNQIDFKLKGGPYYITKLDVVKNHESFINKEFRYLYSFSYERKLLLNGRETIVISFTPVYSLRDVLFEGELYIDLKTWAISKADYNYTKQGLKEVRNSLIQKEPKNSKAIPTELAYSVQYKYIGDKWYLLTVRSSLQIKINNKEHKLRTKFNSIAEIVTTNIEKGNPDNFSRKEIFKPNEIFTEKIMGYDKSFWENYNTIKPESQLIEAFESFNSHILSISNIQPKKHAP